MQEKPSASTRADREIAGSYGPDTVRRTVPVATRSPTRSESRTCCVGHCVAYRTPRGSSRTHGDGEPFPCREVVHTHPQKEHHISEPRINERIRVPEVRLVGPNGEQVGIVRVEDALRLAAEADLDLVEVAPMARPPVAKLMDFGKYKYEAALKAREARKNQVNTVIKEIKLRPKIDPHDYGTKKGHVERFLKAGDKVKVTIMFRGREQSRPELGFRLLQRLAEDIDELGYVESSPKQDGRNMVMVLGPTKKKADARAEQRRRRESGSVAVAHNEPMDLGDLTHLATEIQEPDVADVIEVEEIQEPEVAQVTEVTEVADAPAPAEPAASAPAPAAGTRRPDRHRTGSAHPDPRAQHPDPGSQRPGQGHSGQGRVAEAGRQYPERRPGGPRHPGCRPRRLRPPRPRDRPPGRPRAPHHPPRPPRQPSRPDAYRSGRPHVVRATTNATPEGASAARPRITMPKMKTHSGAKKRFRITGTGKVMREQAGGRHLLERKSSKKMRSIANDVELSKPDAKTARKLLGR